MVALMRSIVGDVQVDLSAVESAVNAKVTKDLFCFVYDNGGGDQKPSGVTGLSGEKTFLTVFF